jgi:ABC-type Co2+ transport system permease subunit
VSPIATRGLLRRNRHRLALIAVVVALGMAIAAHHSPVLMGDTHHPMGAGVIVELCLGVFAAVGAAVLAIALGAIALARWRPARVFAPATLPGVRVPEARGRDGPALLRLLCVCRC